MNHPDQKPTNTSHSDLPNLDQRYFPLRMFAITIASIFIAEIVAMLVVQNITTLPYALVTLIDAGIMVVMIFPILYFFSLRPLIRQIEQLQQLKRMLHQKEELQERFFDSMDVKIAYMDRHFNFIKVNDAYASGAVGYTPEYYVGKNLFSLFPNSESQPIFERVVETGEPFYIYNKPYTFPGQPERGVTYWNWNLQPVKDLQGKVDGLVLSILDVTERQRAAEKVEFERARLHSILDALPDGVYIVNQEFDVEYMNPAVEQDFGVRTTKKCFDYFHNRDEVCPWCKNSQVFDGKTVNGEWLSTKTGKTYEVYDTPLVNADGSISKLKLMHDISSRKQAEAELERRNRELQALTISESRQRQAAETLRLAAVDLSQSLDMDVVLHTLISHLRTIVQADTASVIFPDDNSVFSVRVAEGYEQWIDLDQVNSVQAVMENNPFYDQLLSTRKSILIADTSTEPGWVAVPGTEPIRNRLFVPILVEDRLIGVVALGKAEVGYFSEEHVHWAEALVREAAVAIQNAWLFQQVRAGNERLQTLSRRLVEVQEKERLYVARELHDQASQTLTSLILGLGALEKEAARPQVVREKIEDLKVMTNQVMEELHHLASNLRPASLDHLGLVPALDQLVKSFSRNSNVRIHLKVVGLQEDERFLPELETTLYRVVQEALTNVVRHARASRVDVLLERRDEALLAIIEDDGKGFDVHEPHGSGHMGVMGMQERAEMLGGTFTVESEPGKGTTLYVEVPYDHPDLVG